MADERRGPGSAPAAVDVFISYSRHDAAIAHAVAADLVARGRTTFIDYRAIGGGDEFVSVIGHAVEASEVVLVLLTGRAVESQWVRWEIAWALERHKRIVPLLLESISFRQIFPLASLHHLDFRDPSDAARAIAFRELDELLTRLLPQHARAADRRSGHPPAPAAGDDPDATVSDQQIHRWATESISVRGSAPETAAYLGRLVLQRSPQYLEGWLREFVEAIEAGLRTTRVADFTRRLDQAVRAEDLDLAESIAQDILALSPDHQGARQALRRIRVDRQCAALYAAAAQIMPASLEPALFLLTEVRRLSPRFGDADGLLSDAQMTPATAGLIRQVGTVGPDVVDPHTHALYAYAPGPGVVAVSSFYYQRGLHDNQVAVYRPGDKRSLAIRNPAPDQGEIQGVVTAIALSSSGERVAAGTEGGRVAIWRVAGPGPAVTLPTEGSVLAVAFSPDGAVLATMTTDHSSRGRGPAWPGTLNVWDVDTGRCLGTLPPDRPARANGIAEFGSWSLRWEASQTNIAFGDPATVLAAVWNYAVRVWDYATGEILAGIDQRYAKAVALSHDHLAIGDRDVRLYPLSGLSAADAPTPGPVALGTDSEPVRHLVFSPSGAMLAVVRSNGRVDFVDAHSGEPLGAVDTGVYEPKSASFDAGGTHLFVQAAVLGVSLHAPLRSWPPCAGDDGAAGG